MAAGLAELGHHVIGVDRNAAARRRDVPRRSCASASGACPSSSTRACASRSSDVHDVVRARHPRSRVHLPRGRHPEHARRGREPAQHPLCHPGDRRDRSTARCRSSSTRAPRPSAPARRSRGSSRRRWPAERVAPRIVSNPEFLQQGQRGRGLLHARTGSSSAPAIAADAEAVAALYEALPGERVLTDLRTAEMIKYVANSFLATRISFINEVARPVRGHRRRRRAMSSTAWLDRSAHRPPLLQARHRLRRVVPAQGRRRAALRRRGHGRRDAGPVGGPAGQRQPAPERRCAACAPGSGTLEGKTHRRVGPDLQGRHRGHARLARRRRRPPDPQRGRDASRPTTRGSSNTRPAPTTSSGRSCAHRAVEAAARRGRPGDPHRLARVRDGAARLTSATPWPAGSSSTAATSCRGPPPRPQASPTSASAAWPAPRTAAGRTDEGPRRRWRRVHRQHACCARSSPDGHEVVCRRRLLDGPSTQHRAAPRRARRFELHRGRRHPDARRSTSRSSCTSPRRPARSTTTGCRWRRCGPTRRGRGGCSRSPVTRARR